MDYCAQLLTLVYPSSDGILGFHKKSQEEMSSAVSKQLGKFSPFSMANFKKRTSSKASICGKLQVFICS